MSSIGSFLEKYHIHIAFGMFLAFALALYFMGQIWICKCGYIKFWHGVTFSSENSQHISDWYTFSHIIHGFIFYWLFRSIGKRYDWPVAIAFLLALGVEMGWELFENTDFVINRYREVTISLDYYGDSVMNSVSDAFFMVVGFFMARRMPVWIIVSLALFLEIFTAYYIRDNLTLNVVMLLYPFQFILDWQRGG